jgi:LysM repeat protein
MKRHSIIALCLCTALLQACSTAGKDAGTPAEQEPQRIVRGPDKAYIVQRGDSLSLIARKTTGDGDNWRAIAQYNNITNPNHLRVGEPLMIPGELLPTPPEPVARTEPVAAEPAPEQEETSVETAPSSEPAATTTQWVIVEGSYYPKAIYERPAYTGALVTRVLPGTTLKFLGQNKTWLHVETDKGPGYLHESDARLLKTQELHSSLSGYF